MTKAALVDEIDSLLPDWIIEWVAPAWFPPYLHVLRANPSTVSSVKLDAAWPVKDVTDYDGSAAASGGGDDGAGGGGGGGVARSGAGRGGMRPVMGGRGAARGPRGPSAGTPGTGGHHPPTTGTLVPQGGSSAAMRFLAVDGGLSTIPGHFDSMAPPATSSYSKNNHGPIHSDEGLGNMIKDLVQAVATLQAIVESQAGHIAALTDALRQNNR